MRLVLHIRLHVLQPTRHGMEALLVHHEHVQSLLRVVPALLKVQGGQELKLHVATCSRKSLSVWSVTIFDEICLL